MARLDFEEQKKAIALQKSRLEAKERLVKVKERKALTRFLIRRGEIVSKAGLDGLGNEVLLGALLEVKERSNEGALLKKWREAGAAALECDKRVNGEALSVAFDSETPKELKGVLKGLGFKWNRFRNEWQGYAQRERVVRELKGVSAVIESVG